MERRESMLQQGTGGSLRWVARAASLAFAALALGACATLPNGREWGEDATALPGWARLREAALATVSSPRVWGPLAAAAVFQIDGWDRRTSNWARAHTPVFGSEQEAALWSDRLRSASTFAYVASVLATPSGDRPGEWTLNKLRGAAVGVAAIAVTDEETLLIKNAAGRERPNGQDTQSMPSAHTSRSAVLIQLAERNVESLGLAPMPRTLLLIGLDGLTYATAWARVESGFHFPSDTLVGMSLGNANGAFFNDALLGLEQQDERLSFALTPLPRGMALSWRVGF